MDGPNKATNNGGGCRGVGMDAIANAERPLVVRLRRSRRMAGPLLVLSNVMVPASALGMCWVCCDFV